MAQLAYSRAAPKCRSTVYALPCLEIGNAYDIHILNNVLQQSSSFLIHKEILYISVHSFEVSVCSNIIFITICISLSIYIYI